MSDFRRLHPSISSGAERPLKAKQWIGNMKNLLKVVRIPKKNRVEVVCIQLTDVARTWWLADEVRHQEPLNWKKFMEVFHARFFQVSEKQVMRKKFLELQQRDQVVNTYAAVLVRLSPNLGG